ncbi:MAG: hypothetical protein ABEI76_11455, partial [Halobacteriales archaeon]
MLPEIDIGRRIAFVLFVLLLATGMLFPSGVLAAIDDGGATDPAVRTEHPVNVTVSSATLRGNVTDMDGADSVTVWFQYWQQGNKSETASFAGINPRSTNGTFTSEISDLDRNTTYVYVAYVETEVTTVRGDRVTFRTDATATVEAETRSPQDVTDTSARLVGALETLESTPNATVGFAYWQQGNKSETLIRTDNRTLRTAGPYNRTVYDLLANTTYVARAYATANGSTAVGGPVTFTTARSTPPRIAIESATNVGSTTATLRANLTDLGGASAADVRFTYWVQGERNDTATVTSFMTHNTTGPVTANLSGLTPNTAYEYVAQVWAADGDLNASTTTTFTIVDDTDLVVRTDGPASVTADGAIFQGSLVDLGNASNATVRFAYWEQGARNETLAYTPATTVDDPGPVLAAVTDLEANTSYVYVATAIASDGDTDVGDAVSFETKTDEE